MKYTPYSELDIKNMGVMDEGTYPFKVVEVSTADNYGQQLRDKNGNEMAKLKLTVWDKNRSERGITTYISADSRFAYKLRHFSESIGMLSEYESGTFDIVRTVGRSGIAQIVVRKGTLKQDGSGDVWPDRNDVKDFIPSDATPVVHAGLSGNPATVQDQDIPF